MVEQRKNKWDNCLNAVKLIAAIQVFIGHIVPSFNIVISDGFSFANTIFEGVPIFFCLSGFLIWGSIERSNSFSHFCKKRILRLYPELWGGTS